MNGWRALTVTVCAAAMLCAVLYRLFPDTGIGRQGRFLLPCLFLCAVLTAATGADLSPVWEMSPAAVTAPDPSAVEARMRQQVTQQVDETLLKMVNQALSTYHTQAKKVVSDMDISSSGSITMGQITVYVEEDEIRNAVLIKQVSQKRLGTDVVIARWEENP